MGFGAIAVSSGPAHSSCSPGSSSVLILVTICASWGLAQKFVCWLHALQIRVLADLWMCELWKYWNNLFLKFLESKSLQLHSDATFSCYFSIMFLLEFPPLINESFQPLVQGGMSLVVWGLGYFGFGFNFLSKVHCFSFSATSFGSCGILMGNFCR